MPVPPIPPDAARPSCHAGTPAGPPGAIGTRRALLAGLAALALAGCSALPDKPVRPALYDFGPPAAAAAAPTPPGVARPVLALARIEVPDALDGTAMLYRLAYADAQQLRPYAQARWSMPPAQLLAQRLREPLGTAFFVVPPGAAPAAATLRLELEEFAQVFDTPAQSRAVLRVRATLAVPGPAGRERVLAQQPLGVSRAAETPDAAGGVRALAVAGEALGAELAAWVQARLAAAGAGAAR